MTLKSGADIKIGQREFFLDNSVEEPYAHVLESLYSDTQDITGMDAKTANPNVLLWTYDDFAGGGENKFYSDTIPDTYWKGNCNPRVRGAVTAPPATSASTGTLSETADKWLTDTVGGRLWAGAGRDLFYSTDGTTWAKHNSTSLFGAGYDIDGLTNDGAAIWVSASNGLSRATKRVPDTTTSTTAITDFASTARLKGMGMLEGQIYTWTGNVLSKYDSTESLPLSHSAADNEVHTPFANPGDLGGLAVSETSVVYFTAALGVTHVFEWRFSSATGTFIPRPIWRPAPGFTCRFIACSMGVIYLLGDYLTEVAVLGMSQVNREPLFLSYVGQAFGGEAGATLTPTALAASYGAQIILSIKDASSNYYFVYDAEIDSMTQLDTVATATDGTLGAMATFQNKRVYVGSNADTTARFRSWSMDFAATTRPWDWDSAAYNMGYPMDEKLLFGFEVVQDPTIATGTIQVYYQKDEDGSWVSAGTTPAGQKYTYFNLASNNIKYRNLRLRMLGTNGAKCFSITARSYLNSYQELWRLVIKLRDEKPNSRPTSRQARAEVLRNWFNELAKAKSVVTLLDGRVSPQKGKYTTHTVVVEFPRYGGSRIHRTQGHYEGSAEIVLRSVDVVAT